jgi:hypothetical protein
MKVATHRGKRPAKSDTDTSVHTHVNASRSAGHPDDEPRVVDLDAKYATGTEASNRLVEESRALFRNPSAVSGDPCQDPPRIAGQAAPNDGRWIPLCAPCLGAGNEAEARTVVRGTHMCTEHARGEYGVLRRG